MAAVSEEISPTLKHRPKKFYGKRVAEIGKGVYGNIIATDKNYAVKIIKFKPNHIGPAILSEIVFPVCLHHPAIIKYHDVYIDTEIHKAFLVMDRYLGDLTKLKIRGNRPVFLSIAKQLVTGLAYLTSRNVIHRDIKPQNIFYRMCPGNDTEIQVVYGDFGLSLSRECMVTEKLSNNVYTYWFRAPEIALEAGPYDPRADVWALGCTLYAIYTYRFLFTPIKAEDLVYEIVEKIGMPNPTSVLYPIFYDIVRNLGIKPTPSRDSILVAESDINLLLLNMIDPDPKRRKNIFDIERNPIFYDIESNDCYNVNSIEEDTCNDRFNLFSQEVSRTSMEKVVLAFDGKIAKYINFMILIKHDARISNPAYFVALDIFFRYLDLHPELQKHEIPPITTACLYLGSNFIDYNYTTIEELYHYADVGASVERIHKIALNILSQINYDLMASTPYDKMQSLRSPYSPEVVELAGQLLVAISSSLSLYTRPDIGVLTLKMAAGILDYAVIDAETKLLFGKAIDTVYSNDKEMLNILPARLEAYFLF